MFSQSQKKDLFFVAKVINKKCSLGQWIQRLPHQTVITSPAPPLLRQLKFSHLTKNWFWRLIVPSSTVLDHLKYREDNCPLGLIELSDIHRAGAALCSSVLTYRELGAVSERCHCQKREPPWVVPIPAALLEPVPDWGEWQTNFVL